jgi:hypothetical protein
VLLGDCAGDSSVDGDGSVVNGDGGGDGSVVNGDGGGDAVAVAAGAPLGRKMDVIGVTDDALLMVASNALLAGRPALGRTPPCAPPCCCRRFFLAGDLSRPSEVTAAPGKPIAPSGEPGDKLMPLLKSVAHHAYV